MRSTRDAAQQAIKEFWVKKIPKRVEKALGAALHNLYAGPSGGGGMGFKTAISILSEWWSDVGSNVWYDMQSGEVLTEEPNLDTDEEVGTDDYMMFDKDQNRKLLFGKELAPYI